MVMPQPRSPENFMSMLGGSPSADFDGVPLRHQLYKLMTTPLI
jgi:hypothetical protein